MNQNNTVGPKVLPPSNIAAEEIIIGHLLLDVKTKKYILEHTISNFFTLQRYKILYSYTLNTNQEYSTAETISNLWSQKLLKKVGGISHLVHIIQKAQTVSIHYNNQNYLQYFISILHYNYIKRLLVQYSYSVIQLSNFYQITIEQIYSRAGKYLVAISKSANTEKQTNFRKSISEFLHQFNQFRGTSVKTTSGFHELDKITNGFKAGELIIIAGRPSMGKTSLAINIAYHATLNLKLQVHIFSLEMSKNEILDKIIALTSNVSIQKIQQRVLTKNNWQTIQKACEGLMSLPLCINDHESSSIESIKRQCSSYMGKKKRSLLLTTCS